MSNPWLKFYPSDWRSDPALRMCSIGARGLWMEMLCVMHENGGELSVNGKGLSLKQLATLAGCPDVDALIEELEDAGVFSRRDDGTIYSRRMIRDAEKAEQDKANGRKGGNPDLKPVVNPQDKAQKPEARYQKEEVEKEEPSGSSKKRGSRIPDDFVPDLDWAASQGLSPSQARSEAAQFRDYWTAKAGAGATKLDWPATWRTWVRSAVNRMPRARGSPGPGRPEKRDPFKDLAQELTDEHRRESGSSRNDPQDARGLPILTIEHHR